MRVPLVAFVLLFAALGGCSAIPIEPEPSRSSPVSPPTSVAPTTTWTAPCHYGATATWHEPGLFSRAKNASFTLVLPDQGAGVAEPGIVAAYGAFNLTRVIRQGPGDTGTLRSLNFITTPEPLIVGDFHANNTTEQRKNEFLAFAQPILAANDATLRSWADQFAMSTPKEPGSPGQWVKVSGPFKTDSFLASVRPNGTDRSSEARRVVWQDGAWSLEAYVTILQRKPTQADAADVQVNQMDKVAFFAPGMRERAGAWAAANQTFGSFAWPHPDLREATVGCS